MLFCSGIGVAVAGEMECGRGLRDQMKIGPTDVVVLFLWFPFSFPCRLKLVLFVSCVCFFRLSSICVDCRDFFVGMFFTFLLHVLFNPCFFFVSRVFPFFSLVLPTSCFVCSVHLFSLCSPCLVYFLSFWSFWSFPILLVLPNSCLFLFRVFVSFFSFLLRFLLLFILFWWLWCWRLCAQAKQRELDDRCQSLATAISLTQQEQIETCLTYRLFAVGQLHQRYRRLRLFFAQLGCRVSARASQAAQLCGAGGDAEERIKIVGVCLMLGIVEDACLRWTAVQNERQLVEGMNREVRGVDWGWG